MIEDGRSPEKMVVDIYIFITPFVKLFKIFPFFYIFSVKKLSAYYKKLQSFLIPEEDFRLNVNA